MNREIRETDGRYYADIITDTGTVILGQTIFDTYEEALESIRAEAEANTSTGAGTELESLLNELIDTESALYLNIENLTDEASRLEETGAAVRRLEAAIASCKMTAQSLSRIIENMRAAI